MAACRPRRASSCSGQRAASQIEAAYKYPDDLPRPRHQVNMNPTCTEEPGVTDWITPQASARYILRHSRHKYTHGEDSTDISSASHGLGLYCIFGPAGLIYHLSFQKPQTVPKKSIQQITHSGDLRTLYCRRMKAAHCGDCQHAGIPASPCCSAPGIGRSPHHCAGKRY